MTTTARLFESKSICFCTPTLLKIKLGNIFNIDYNFNELNEYLEYYNQIYNKKDILKKILPRRENHSNITEYLKTGKCQF